MNGAMARLTLVSASYRIATLCPSGVFGTGGSLDDTLLSVITPNIDQAENSSRIGHLGIGEVDGYCLPLARYNNLHSAAQ